MIFWYEIEGMAPGHRGGSSNLTLVVWLDESIGMRVIFEELASGTK